MRLASLVIPLAALTCIGCPRDPEPEEADYCSMDMVSDTSMLPTRELQVGLVVDGVFTAWSDGQEVELVFGFQGFPMITPWFELPVEPGDQDSACFHVFYEYLDANGDPFYEGGKFSAGLVFERVGDVMRSGPLFDISDDGVGDTVSLRTIVSTPDFVAVEEVSIVLIDP